MTIVPQLPEELYEARDTVIGNVHKGLEPPESIELIHEWLKGKGWDALLGSIENETMAVNFPRLADSFNDAEYISDWLGEEHPITDSMRIAHIHMLIEQAIENGDGWKVPSVCSFDIQRDDGKTAVISCTIAPQGDDGPETSWWGVYKTRQDFLEDLKKAGLIPVKCIDDLSDDELLAYWQST
jgi:hypothetical protein